MHLIMVQCSMSLHSAIRRKQEKVLTLRNGICGISAIINEDRVSNENCCSTRCLAHIINLATQVLISTRSKAKHYNPHNVDEHASDVDAVQQDKLGLVRATCVKVRYHAYPLFIASQ